MKRNLLILFVLVNFSVFAQKSEIKFGKVSEDEIKMKDCSFYPDADAMVLGDVGDLRFQYDSDKGWQYVFSILVRKKIFTNEGKEEGNIKLRLYNPIKGGNKEELISLKAFTYNLENGKVEKTKMSNDDKFETRINDYWVEVGFALPGIKNGSVIEYQYEIVSDYITNLRTWYFQSDIPTAYSDFTFVLPEYFVYQVLSLGTVLELDDKVDGKHETFDIVWRELRGLSSEDAKFNLYSGGGNSDKHEYQMTSNSLYRRIIAKDVKPIEDEPYMANRVDAPARLEFQLDYIQFKNQPVKPIAGTYQKFNETLLKAEDFGLKLNNTFFAKDWTDAVAGKDEIAKAKSIYIKARNHFIFDGTTGIYSDKAGRNAYTSKKGSVADINLSLVAALKDAGLAAHPVILSTKNHGTPHPVYPSFDDYNYVVAAILIGEDIILADAASNMPFGKLPFKCLNGKGWMVSDQGRFINLKVDNPNKMTRMIETSIEDGQLISKYSIKEEDYAAVITSNSYKKEQKEFEQDLKSSFEDGVFSEITYHDDNSNEVFKYEYQIERDVEDADVIYIQPFFDGVFLENPFKREERSSNIDFTYQFYKKAVAIITIPEGYTTELPESVNLKLPEGVMSFKYQVVKNNNTLNIVSLFKIKETEYQASEYLNLKEFFQLMADKNNQMVVLKKI